MTKRSNTMFGQLLDIYVKLIFNVQLDKAINIHIGIYFYDKVIHAIK